jgi:hypothetical protein
LRKKNEFIDAKWKRFLFAAAEKTVVVVFSTFKRNVENTTIFLMPS